MAIRITHTIINIHQAIEKSMTIPTDELGFSLFILGISLIGSLLGNFIANTMNEIKEKAETKYPDLKEPLPDIYNRLKFMFISLIIFLVVLIVGGLFLMIQH
jgi:hypothetical protein